MLTGRAGDRKSDYTTFAKVLMSLYLLLLINNPVIASEDNGIRVFTSENAQSNAARSFVVVPKNLEIPEGITRSSTRSVLREQSPFMIEILDDIDFEQQVQWVITIPSNDFGRIWVHSDYSGRKKVGATDTVWTSFALDYRIPERHILLFEPREKKHGASVYTGDKPLVAGGTFWNGGTEGVGVPFSNPRLRYLVEARILDADGSLVARYDTQIEMDDKDMIRQEYINQYRSDSSNAGENGLLPVPSRDEIRVLPNPSHLSERRNADQNEYSWIIGDGASDLASLLLNAYEGMKSFYRQPGNELKDLNGQTLSIPESRLSLSSGWPTPVHNDWINEALEGVRQLGIGLDLMPNETARDKKAAIVYWVLWEAVSSLPDQHKFLAQLEALAEPLRPSAFQVDVEPRNGIPDAFDKADHLHISLIYDNN